jgi:hypothetical protein
MKTNKSGKNMSIIQGGLCNEWSMCSSLFQRCSAGQAALKDLQPGKAVYMALKAWQHSTHSAGKKSAELLQLYRLQCVGPDAAESFQTPSCKRISYCRHNRHANTSMHPAVLHHARVR